MEKILKKWPKYFKFDENYKLTDHQGQSWDMEAPTCASKLLSATVQMAMETILVVVAG